MLNPKDHGGFPVRHHHGKYSVEMFPDGAIFVKHGDSLSVYAAAIAGDASKISHFSRRRQSGLEPIRNTNLILAGEIIYYTPAHNAHHLKLNPNHRIVADPAPRPRREADRVLVDDLIKRGHLRIDKRDIYMEAVKALKNNVPLASHVLTLFGEILGWISEDSPLPGINVPFFPLELIHGLLEINESHDVYDRPVKAAAAAYATEYWMHGRQVPSITVAIPKPDLVMGQLMVPGQSAPEGKKDQVNAIWKTASESVTQDLDSKAATMLAKFGTSKAQLQQVYCLKLGNAPGDAAAALLDGFASEQKWSGVELAMLTKAYYPVGHVYGK